MNVLPGKQRGFTLIELLIVIAIIGILIALIFPVLNQAKAAGKKSACTTNLHQMGEAAALYLNDHDQRYPPNSYFADSGHGRPNAIYWYFGLVFSTAELAAVDGKQGMLYPYQKDTDLVACPEAKSLKPAFEGAPFTVTMGSGPVGYDKNVLIVQGLPANTTGGVYGPFPKADQWADTANTVLLADTANPPSNFAPATMTYLGISLPKSLTSFNARGCPNANVAARHNGQANFVMMDGHSMSAPVWSPPDIKSEVGTYFCSAPYKTGYLIGPGVSPTAGKLAPAGTNYYFVPDKNPANSMN